jgi:hypothetical protein
MIDSYHLYISETRLLLRRRRGFLWWRKVSAAGEWHWDAAKPSSLQLEQLRPATKWRADLHVVVGSGLCKFMALSLPPGLDSAEEQRAAGQAQFQHQLGLDPSEWQCAIDVAAAPGKSVLCAVRISMLERIRTLSQANGFRLVSFKPFVAGVWNAALALRHASGAGESVLLVVENEAFTVLIDRAGDLASINALAHAGEADLVEREIRRVGFSLGSDAEDSVRLALSPDMLALGQDHPQRLLTLPGRAAGELHADFRDLSFAPAKGEVA